MPDPLITADELAALLGASDRVRVLDVRWSLGGPPGLRLYREGHIPGAVYVDLETRAGRARGADRGSPPAAGGAALQEAARRWGHQRWRHGRRLRRRQPAPPRPGPGGCCATPGWTTSACSTGRSPRGRPPGIRCAHGDATVPPGRIAAVRDTSRCCRWTRPAPCPQSACSLTLAPPSGSAATMNRSIRGQGTSRARAVLRHPRTSDADGRFLPVRWLQLATPLWACGRMPRWACTAAPVSPQRTTLLR